VQILVQRGGDEVFDRSADGITRKSRTYTFAESGSACAVLAGAVHGLSQCRPTEHPSKGPFAYDRALPVVSIGMFLTCSGPSSRVGEENENDEAMPDLHVICWAISPSTPLFVLGHTCFPYKVNVYDQGTRHYLTGVEPSR
jgi:hypothetical protein